MKSPIAFYLFLCLFTPLLGQVTKESTEVDFIKSIQFEDQENQNQFPLIRLGESFTLSFDDLLAQDNDYYYRIKHYNSDWTPSELFLNQYLNGYDNQRISDHKSSYGTLQSYTHYRLTLPNSDTQFIVSGNYMLEVYDAADALVFKRKFLIYEEKSNVRLDVYPSQNLENFNTHQNLQFTIDPIGFQVRNPNIDLKVVLLQNSQWNSAFFAPPPQYNNGNRFEYRYDSPTQFSGGNEFLFFDTKDLRASTPNISYVDKEELYQHYLYTDVPRKDFPYSYYPDINGNFLIQTLQGTEANIEADYSIVYFSLAKQYALDNEEIYIYGKFNNYELTEENKMIYNPNLEVYEGILLLKQGFYNYTYVSLKDEVLDKSSISGAYANTENHYTVLVYHRGIGQRYDQLIGFGQRRSFSLKQ